MLHQKTIRILICSVLWSCLGTLFFIQKSDAAEVSWINALGGNWSVGTNWSTGTAPGPSDNVSITLAGNYTVTMNVDATVSSLTLGSTLGAQTLTATDHKLTVNGASTITEKGTFNCGTVEGTGTLTNQGTLNVSGSTISVDVINQGMTKVSQNGSLNGSFTSESNGKVEITGTGPTLTFAKGFINKGVVESKATADATIRVTSGTLVNASNAAIKAQGQAQLIVEAEVKNQGTMACETGNLVIKKASATHVNSGTMSATGGTVTVNQSGPGAVFKNDGTINLENNNKFIINGGTLENTTTGRIEGSGVLALESVSFVNNGTLSGNVSLTQGTGNQIPVVANVIANQSLSVQGSPFNIDLKTVFSDADGDQLTFTASSSNPAVASANLSGSSLIVVPVPTITGNGSVIVTVTAKDGNGGSASTSFVTSVSLTIILQGDFDHDGRVVFNDFLLFAQAFGKVEVSFDLNLSGLVDFADFLIFAQNYGKSTAQAGKPARMPAGINGHTELTMKVLPGTPENTIDVAVYLQDAAQVQGYQLNMAYNALALELINITAPTLSRLADAIDAQSVAIQIANDPGKITLADVTQTQLIGAGELVRLSFRVLNETLSQRVDITQAFVADGQNRINELAGTQLELAVPRAYKSDTSGKAGGLKTMNRSKRLNT